MADEIAVIQSPKQMALGEAAAWLFDFDPNTPASVTSFLAYDETMTSQAGVLSGSTSITGNIVTGKMFTPATAQDYTLLCKVVISGNTLISTLLCEVYNPVAGITLSNSYATIKELKHYIAPGTAQDKFDDEVMAHLLESASRWIDTETQRTFYARTATNYYDVPCGNNPRRLTLDDDLLTVTTLTNGDGAVLTTADYFLEPYNKAPYYSVVMKQSSSKFWALDTSGNSERVISIAGTWGWVASVPKDIKEACLQIARNAYKRRFGENVDTVSTITAAGVIVEPRDIPYQVKRTMEYYRRLL